MKGWPGLLVVAAVVVALVANVIMLGRSGLLAGARELAELKDTVAALSSRVAELKTAVRELQATLNPRPASADLAERDQEANEPDEAIKLPPSGEINPDPVDIVLAVDQTGACTLGGRSLERDRLGAELKRVLNANPAMQLVVRAHKDTRQSDVEAILETARQAGIYRVSLPAPPGDQEGGGENPE
jgi:biopolymer transport protein ExbD